MWVRSPRNANTVVGLAVDTTNVESVRDQSTFVSGALTSESVGAAFTVQRLLLWWEWSSLRAGSAATAESYGFVGARVGNNEEFEEFATNVAYLAENAPQLDKEADWFLWNPAMASDVTEDDGALNFRTHGRGQIDIRSARRVDEPGEDVFVFSSVTNVLAADTSTLHMSWAALCLLH